MRNPYIKKISILSGVLGSIQSVTWCALCVVQFLYYSGRLSAPSYPKEASYKIILTNVMYDLFIRKDTDMLDFNHKYSIYINGNVALSLAIIYFTLSILWFITSMCLIKVAIGHNLYKNGWILILWTFLTIILCFLDVATCGILISDYTSVAKIALMCEQCVVYPVAIAIGLFIACRGIILWITNIAFAVLLLYLVHVNIKEFGDTENKELKWYKRLGFFRFKIPRPRLGSFMHKIRNPNDWWLFENSDISGSNVSAGTEARGRH